MYTHPLYHWPPKGRWTYPQSPERSWGAMGAYAHFPFCRSICDYCGYETRLVSKTGAELVETSIAEEIDAYRNTDDFSNAELASFFFGGGTASLFSLKGMEVVLEAARAATGAAVIDEVTLECEPGTIGAAKLAAARELGVNRISICAQSFNDDELRRLTRKHDSFAALSLVDDAIAAGIENRHIDLMYGFAGQTLDDWASTLRFVVSLPIHHVSAYKLYVFKYGMLDRTQVAARPDRESDNQTRLVGQMYELACETFEAAGFRQYTLTEWALPGYESRYLTDTFAGRDIMPLGPSSFGRCGSEVWHNPTLYRLYADQDAWRASRKAYPMTAIEGFKRDVILGMWLLRVDVLALATKWSVVPSDVLMATLHRLADEGGIAFGAGEISIRQPQRFGVGNPMQRLAELATRSWGVEDRVGRPSREDTERSTSHHSPHLATVLRMARRDPKFFASLSSMPRECLGELVPPLPEADLVALLTTIESNSSRGVPVADPLARDWSAICNEHRSDTIRAAERQ